MTKARKKPVVIDTVQFDGRNVEEINAFVGQELESKVIDLKDGTGPAFTLTIQTLEGQHTASPGDWIIKGVNGEFYPCKPDIFDKTYDFVEKNEVPKQTAQVITRTVFPSTEPTIFVFSEKGYLGGCHRYVFNDSLGFKDGKAEYDKHSQVLQFVQKDEDGNMIPGVQSEQLVIALIDRTQKLNARFPSEFNERMMVGLEMFLKACQDRVQDRIDRGVMGELKK